jgi:tetratricopeptide (TPR) repeat protein
LRGSSASLRFDERVSDIFALQDTISEEVARGLLLKLSEADKEKLTWREENNPEAYQAYLKGRFFWNKRNRDGYEKALEYFKQAIALDPNYAEAHAGMSDAYHFIGVSGDVPRNEVYAKSRAAARRALELDETLAEAHASLGLIAMNYDWDWPTAEKEFRRAIELNPNYAKVRSNWQDGCCPRDAAAGNGC